MKRVIGPMDWLDTLYVYGLLLIFGLIVLHAPISVALGTLLPEHVLLVKSWKEILMGALLVMAGIIVTLRGAWGRCMRDPVILISLALAVVYTLSLQFSHGFKPYAAGLLIDIRYILYFVLVYVAVVLFPVVRKPFVITGLVGASIVVGFGLLQFILPHDFLKVLGYSTATIAPYTTIDNYDGLVRLQSTLRGPNPLGAYAMIVAIIAGVAAIKGKVTKRQRIWLWVLTAAALIILAGSYSRSAYIGLFIGAGFAGAMVIGRQTLLTRNVLTGVVIGLIVIVIGVYSIRTTTFYTSVLRHEVAGSGPAINSDEGHSQSLKNGVSAILTHPFGYGTGSTGSASLLSDSGYIVENQYLYVAHEAGYAALGLFVALVVILLRRLYSGRRDPLAIGVAASGVGLLVIGMFLPVFADDTVSVIWFGLAGLVAGGHKDDK